MSKSEASRSGTPVQRALQILAKHGLFDAETGRNKSRDEANESLQATLDDLVTNGSLDQKSRTLIEELVDEWQMTVTQSINAEVTRQLSDDEAIGDDSHAVEGPAAHDATVTVASDRAIGSTIDRAGSSPQPQTSTRFGDYEIINEIARGGMGIVYQARQISLNRIVALKKILSGQLANEDDLKRFQLEAEASAGLDHPGIVPVHEIGEHEGQHFFSMGFVEGQSLAQRILIRPLTPHEAAELLIKICRAVEYANKHGVIHRDLKPSNVLMDKGNEPRITDFGLAKKSTQDSGMTATGQILGTPSYMSPEQASGRSDQVDQRADVYALGAILYACLTGRPPFQSANPMETLIQVREQEPLSIRKLVASTPNDLETICLKCLSKEPSKRYQSAEELAADLNRWRQNEPIVARRVSRLEKSWKWCVRNPILVSSVSAVVTAFVIGSIVFWERQNASHANQLVELLLNVDDNQVPEQLDELDRYRWWTLPRLANRLTQSESNSPDELRLSLALVHEDARCATTLLQHLPTAKPSQVQLIKHSLVDLSSPEVTRSLWETMHDSKSSDLAKLNAACVLSALDADNEHWNRSKTSITSTLIKTLSTNPRDYNTLVSMLEPARMELSESIGMLIHDSELTALEQQTALNVFLEYAVDQPQLLCDVAMDSETDTFHQLFPFIEMLSTESAAILDDEIALAIEPTMNVQEKEQLGRRQARALIALWRLDKLDDHLELLNQIQDPRSGSFFIAMAREYGLSPSKIADRIDLQIQDDQKLFIQTRLLHALGNYDEDDISPDILDSLTNALLEAYQLHPDSGIHGSTAWLIRKWGLHDQLEDANEEISMRQSNTEESPIELRPQWYINGQGHTMIVIEMDTFMMGTAPDSDPLVEIDELYHERRIGRTVAFASTEVSKGQFRAFFEANPSVLDVNNSGLAQYARTEDTAMIAVSWFEAVKYCNWLSEVEGIPEDQWCYEPNIDMEYAEGMRLKDDFWKLTGYRLPTEAEWEFACRAGSETRYYFGFDEALLPAYSRFDETSEQHLWPVGHTMPNAIGLFDMHGNAMEWCQDELDNNYSKADPLEHDGDHLVILDEINWDPVTNAMSRRLKGGGFNWVSRASRSAFRHSSPPNGRTTANGFRVVRTHLTDP